MIFFIVEFTLSRIIVAESLGKTSLKRLTVSTILLVVNESKVVCVPTHTALLILILDNLGVLGVIVDNPSLPTELESCRGK